MSDTNTYTGTQASGLAARMRAKLAAETSGVTKPEMSAKPTIEAAKEARRVYPEMPDEFYACEPSMLSYHFEDIDRKPIPNEFGWRVIKYLKPSCVHDGRPIIPHTEVNPILAQHSRDELTQILKNNDDAWVPAAVKAKKSMAP